MDPLLKKLQTFSNLQNLSKNGRPLRVGLNGFGRIGRAFTRIALLRGTFDVVAINTRKTPTDMMAYLLQYDSIYRKFNAEIKLEADGFSVNGKKIVTLQNATIESIPWEEYGVDVVVDATGAFTTKVDLQKHLKGTVKRVILTAPSKDEDTPHIVLGVNEDTFDWENNTIISNASCTTNCSAPMFKVIYDNLGIISGFLTTTHAYTLTQSALDDTAATIDKARSGVLNISPSTTGAAKAVARVIPQIKERIDGMAIRVPVPDVSFTDISVLVEKQTTIAEVNELFKKAAETTMKNVLHYETAHLVSSDYIGSPYSCILDSNYTKVINGNFIKIFGWYDNEWGYSTRLVDLVEKLKPYIISM